MDLTEKIVALAKRRGFVYPSCELYGGLANTWDFGPVGVLLKNNLRDLWWKKFVLDQENMVGIDASTILRPEVWQASGHVAGFNDILVDCKECQGRFRADHLIEDAAPDLKVEGLGLEKLDKIIVDQKINCPKCRKNSWTKARKFNQLVEVKIGTLEEGKNLAYLRGEIAQGIFLNFKNVLNTTRVKLPFGIAQQGKAFRAEITTGPFVHRTFEFDLMEFEYFIEAKDWQKVYEEFQKKMWEWALTIGLDEKKLRWREHAEHERSFYSQKTMDIEYEYPFGWKEMFGIAYRTDYDLKNHSEKSGVDLSYLDPKTNQKFTPHVIEPTFGLSRLVNILLFDAYHEDNDRIFLKFSPNVAPYKVAVFPLLANKPELVDGARKIYKSLKSQMMVVFDDRGNIGKRYLSQDEIGTPFCVTFDFQSLEDKMVTVRDRDTTRQERVAIDRLADYFQNKLSR